MAKMRLGFPSVFGMRVAFPRDQVLSSTRRSSVGVDDVHLIFLLSFNELARLGNEVGVEFRSFLVGGKK